MNETEDFARDSVCQKMLHVAASADEVFNKLYDQRGTMIGFSRGPEGSHIVTIDCSSVDKRLALVAVPAEPGVVRVAVGRPRSEEIHVVREFPLDELATGHLLELMRANFT